jgi:hypothetical protein
MRFRFMNRITTATILLTLMLGFAMFLCSCSSNVYPYKRKKPSNCDCSRWAYEMENIKKDNHSTIESVP